jgi:hypothetical protein
MSLTRRDVRTLTDKLLGKSHWNVAGHDYATVSGPTPDLCLLRDTSNQPGSKLSTLSLISLDSGSCPGAKSLGIASPKSSFLPFGSATPPEAKWSLPGIEPKARESQLTTLG